MAEIASSRGIRQKNGDFGIGEPLRLKTLNDGFSLALGGSDTEYGFGHR
ncbi:hypothetical protein CfE428DRAFT_5594 [Chthoniobacter flavus Ellin428]|uniref:Uncharacterized protein n=1 Tax=Chthoniobacter flavus Ellin428 TaxID=497964 RepID=B4D9K4_9BACT|nr:hypothetical protein CfE428DRAFT_5594 [Chthoniobacter flavus Ellin428]